MAPKMAKAGEIPKMAFMILPDVKDKPVGWLAQSVRKHDL